MSNRPHITLKQIDARASAQSFSRGENYYHTGAITDTVRRENEIEARCQGSYPDPYRVWAKLSDSNIVATGCNCEYDWGGDCKHIVALLLTYLNAPDQFEERQTLEDTLQSRSKEDLIDIIMMMVARYPELQDIVDDPTPNEIATDGVPLDTLNYRQELRNAFGGYDYDDYSEYGDFEPGRAMNKVTSVANRLAEHGDWLNASAVYRTVLEEFARMDEGYFYPHDDLYENLYSLTSALEQCLAQPIISGNDDERRSILHALLGVFLWDMYMGGYGLSDEMPELILRFIQREDIVSIRQRVEKARDQQRKRLNSDWGADSYTEFLTNLDLLDDVDEDTIIGRLRGEGMDYLLTARLLEFNRINEAIEVIREYMHGTFEQVRALTLLVQHGHKSDALQVAEDILADEYDYRLANWLLDCYKVEGHKEGMLRWQRRQMAERPNVQDYGELKAVAQALDRWDDLRSQIIHELETEEHYAVLTQVYLHDEQWEQAWDTLPKVKDKNYYGPALELEVAEATHHEMPEHAIPVFTKYARQHIDHRGRDNYQQAANLLAKVQQAYDQLGEIETWEALINDIRTEFKRLPALQDELNKAGL